MNDGFVTVAAVTPRVKVADVAWNTDAACACVEQACEAGAQVVVLPECCLTAYTCNDLFWQQALVRAAEQGLASLAERTASLDALVVAGLPLSVNGNLYNVGAVLCHGRVLGVVPKRHIPTYNEFYEGRYFEPGRHAVVPIAVAGQQDVPFGMGLLFRDRLAPDLCLGLEVCEDLWVPQPPSIGLAQAGATLVVNLSASNALVGKAAYRRDLVVGQSARLVCAYAYASSGWGESTQDVVFSGHDLVAENGRLLSEAAPFGDGVALAQVDLAFVQAERRRLSTYVTVPGSACWGSGEVPGLSSACSGYAGAPGLASACSGYGEALGAAPSCFGYGGVPGPSCSGYREVPFDLPLTCAPVTRWVDPRPFVPDDPATRAQRCEDILTIQAWGLAKRLEHTGARTAVVGVSGGLDSTLALLVTARAFDLVGLDRKGILAVTMPGFGTTGRTRGNAVAMSQALGCRLREVPIAAAVRQHFADIGHDEAVHDVTYENSQARERTQILMDLANQAGGLVIGTGDLSELALGWATYNGDHMSMYAVNSGVPKTLVRHLVRHVADGCQAGEGLAAPEAAAGAACDEGAAAAHADAPANGVAMPEGPEASAAAQDAVAGDAQLARVLLDVLDTPVSPELLPAEADGTIAQRTEDLVGPYELHDFFLYQVLRCGFEPAKVYRLACRAFVEQPEEKGEAPVYDRPTILRWLRTFYRRFFAQQFKRSCLPDGPKVGSVAVSPRGDLRMPSDASAALWLAQVDALEA